MAAVKNQNFNQRACILYEGLQVALHSFRAVDY